MTRSSVLGFILVGLILALAAILFVRQYDPRSANPLPGGAGALTYWYCHQCERGFELSPREYEGLIEQQPATMPDGRPDPLGRTILTVRCPTCGGNAVSAYRCLTDGTIFDARAPDGSARGCPKCGWNPLSK